MVARHGDLGEFLKESYGSFEVIQVYTFPRSDINDYTFVFTPDFLRLSSRSGMIAMPYDKQSKGSEAYCDSGKRA